MTLEEARRLAISNPGVQFLVIGTSQDMGFCHWASIDTLDNLANALPFRDAYSGRETHVSILRYDLPKRATP